MHNFLIRRKERRRKMKSSSPRIEKYPTSSSPTSVVTVPLSATKSDRSALCAIDTNASSPQFHKTPTKTSVPCLLDTEITPSPNKSCPYSARVSLESDSSFGSTPQRLPFCDTVINQCCNSFNSMNMSCSQGEAYCNILGLLSADESTSSSWQMWSLDNLQQQPAILRVSSNTSEVKENIDRVLQNRAFHMSAKKKRLSTLKQNMHFERSLQSPSSDLFRSRSFQLPKSRPIVKEKEFSFWNIGYCGQQTVSEEETDPTYPDDSHCYDSDPEEFLRHSFDSVIREKRLDDDKENVPPPTAKLDKCVDVEVVKDEIQRFMNQTWAVRYHSKDSKSSIAVHVWTERGIKFNGVAIPPKLCFDSVGGGKVGKVFSALDVLRVVTPKRINRDLYPFAKPKLLVLVKTMDDSALFEFRCVKQRDSFVYGFRLLVSRLGSLLVVGDSDLHEFFQVKQPGPGEVPFWLDDEEGQTK